jgi:hypothetical protein
MTSSPSASQWEMLLTQWNDWLGTRTDAMLSLEDRVRSAGTAEDRSDLAAAFVARKSVADRLQEVDDLAKHDREQAVALANQPLVDSLGGTVGKNLNDAADLVDAIVQRVEQHVSSVEQRAANDVATAAAADRDLVVAERLAATLGSHMQRAAQLRGALSAGNKLGDVAAQAAALRHELENADGDRQQLFERWAGLSGRVRSLGETEKSVRELAQRCRDKIVDAPNLAVPSVAAVGDLVGVDSLTAMAWAAARATMVPVLTKVDRIDAALTEARRRFQRPLDERDGLRGLLQSFRDKAATHGFGEDADVEPKYRHAQAVLWAAPCDLDEARRLVDSYVAAVNGRDRSTTSPREDAR